MKFLITLLILASCSAYSQESNVDDQSLGLIGLNYMPGTSNFTFGFELASFHKERMGWYGNLKMNAGAEDSKVSYQTAKNYFGDSERNSKFSYYALTVGRTYVINDYLFVSFGGGLDSWKKYVEFYDPTGILGQGGKYYVLKDSGTYVVAEAKIYYKPTIYSFTLSGGYQTGNAQTILGLNWVF
jgi:hypothetical protein